MIDEIRQCPVCEGWYHVSWFDVGERGCKNCQAAEKSYLDGLMRVAQEERMIEGAIKGEMGRIVRDEIKPAAVTPTQWRVLQMLDQGSDAYGISIAFGVTSFAADQLIEEALAALMKVAESEVAPKEDDDGTQVNDPANRILIPGQRRKGRKPRSRGIAIPGQDRPNA